MAGVPVEASVWMEASTGRRGDQTASAESVVK